MSKTPPLKPVRARTDIQQRSTPKMAVHRAMRRGEVWTAAGGKDYAGKPRPVVIVQDDDFDATESITVCPITIYETEAPIFRLLLEPNDGNGLRVACRLMVDKITTVPKSKMGTSIGRLDDDDLLRLNRALLVFLGLAGSQKARGAD